MGIIDAIIRADVALNEFVGGLPGETICGAVGRALKLTPPPLWARGARAALDHLLTDGHCRRVAARELTLRTA